jgi:hypothetical protein
MESKKEEINYEEFNYIPKTLKETHDFLDKFLQDKEAFKNHPEETVIEDSHKNLSRFLRNKWHLWWSPEWVMTAKEMGKEEYPTEIPELVKWFKSIGVDYADDMSGIIIISYHKYLNNKPYDLDEDVRAIKNFYMMDALGNNFLQNEQDIIQSKKNEQE